MTLAPIAGRNLDVEPLSHDDLLAHHRSPNTPFSLTLNNVARIDADGSFGVPSTADMCIASSMTEPLYGLVELGWIPFPFGGTDIALVDRNVVSRLGKLQIDTSSQQRPAIHPQLNLSYAGQSVSPLPYVLEGSARQLQSGREIRKSLAQAIKALRRVLPDAQIPPVDEARHAGLIGLLADQTRFFRKAVPFLMQVSPSVAHPSGARQQAEIEKKILREATAHKLPLVSFVVLAVLSCLYDNDSSAAGNRVRKPGRAVIKPSPRYSEGDAYAALSDLISLEFIVMLKSLGFAQRPALYTHDLGLAAFWSALNMHDFCTDERGTSKAKLTLGPSLFPALSEDQCADLRTRLIC